MHARKREVVQANTKGVEFLFRKNKVTWLKGEGRILGAGRVSVAGTDYETKAIVIASGSESTPLSGVEVDEQTDRHVDRRAGTFGSSAAPRGDRRRRDRAWNSAASGTASARR